MKNPFLKATPEQLEAIRTKIKAYQAKELRWNIILAMLGILILFYCF